MAVKTEKDLEGNSRELWLKALSAMELKNYGYAVSLLHEVLRETPEFLSGRQLLRKAQIGNTKGKKSFLGGLGKPSLGGFKNKSKIEKDPLAAMREAEKSLDSDPGSNSANRLLKEAAVAAGMPEVAMFALETLHEANPKDTKILHELAAFYLQNDEPEKALDAYNRITELNPSDLEAIKGGKDASAQASMSSGGWQEAESYRDIIKDKDEAVSLEQKGRIVRSKEAIENLLAELSEEYEKNPQNIEVVKRIASLYEQKEDRENAVQWYEYAFSLSGNSDTSLRRKAADLKVQLLDRRIEELEARLESGALSEDENSQLATLKADRAEMVLSECRRRVENNPTDLHLRFELGEQLYLAGKYKEAMPELQKAKQSSNVKVRAANLLGQCMVHLNMLDMAAKQFEDAIASQFSMDSTKKDLLYNLALTYQKMDDEEKYLDAIKQIYEVDMSYRDVDERVQASYQS